jgi:hypothetical protein
MGKMVPREVSMIISIQAILSPRRPRCCSVCGQPISGPQLRVYGSPHDSNGGPKHVYFSHPQCFPEPNIHDWRTQWKLLVALRVLRAEPESDWTWVCLACGNDIPPANLLEGRPRVWGLITCACGHQQAVNTRTLRYATKARTARMIEKARLP